MAVVPSPAPGRRHSLIYGALSVIVLARPSGGASLSCFDRWTALIGLLIVQVSFLSTW